MIKKSISILLLLVMVSVFSGCIPPFYDGGIDVNDFFENDVRYTTFTISADEVDGFLESDEGIQRLADYTDGDEKNIEPRQYKRITFTTKAEGARLTELSFICQADAKTEISFAVYCGERYISSSKISLAENVLCTVYFSGLDIGLVKEEKFSIVITNPIEIGTVSFRTDTYIFIGQEV